MITRDRFSRLGLCAIALGAFAASRPLLAAAAQPLWAWEEAHQAGEQDVPMPVTTDTPEYCTHLEVTVMSHPNPPPDVKHLLLEGHLLCDHGQVREGIAHLRRALLILKHQGSATLVP